MRNNWKFGLVICYLLVLLTSCYSQNIKSNTKNGKTYDDLKQIATRFSEGLDGHSIGIDFEYDKSEDITFATVVPPSLYTDKGETIHMIIYFSFSGEILVNQNDLSIEFASVRKKATFLKSNDLTFLADKEQIKLGSAKHKIMKDSGIVMESMNYQISKPQLQKIADAKNIQFQIGSTKGSFEIYHKKAVNAVIVMLK